MNNSKLMNANVKLDVVIGSTECAINKLAKIEPGTIIELNSYAGEPAELRSGGKLIAFGEVVVIDENFGMRVTKVIEKEFEN